MAISVTPEAFDAVLFDLDGVLTSTRSLHQRAWAAMFERFLRGWDDAHGCDTEPFHEPLDYVHHVDGKPRQEGVRDFLASRGITLAEGTPDSPPEEESIWGLGNRKQEHVERLLEANGVVSFPGSIAWARELRANGIRTAVVSSSRNCERVLELAGIAELFDARVDGITSMQLGLAGKPAPDGFLEGARRLGVDPKRTVVVEDAIAGVQAGRAGGFGLVIGVDREDQREELLAEGADVVVADLGELTDSVGSPIHPAGPKAHRLMASSRWIVASTGDYPVEPFRLIERSYNPQNVGQTESLFALTNGYLGIRGSFEEGVPAHSPGTLLNGFYETRPIQYAEDAYGFARTGQSLLNVPDGMGIRLFVDGDPIDGEHVEVLEFQRELDMEGGVLERSVVYQLARGRRLWVRSQRFVSLVHRHLAAVRYEITALDQPTTLSASSELVTHYQQEPTTADPRRGLGFPRGVLEPIGEQHDGERALLGLQTSASKLRVVAGMDHDISGENISHVSTTVEGDSARVLYQLRAPVGHPVVITKYLAYHHGTSSSDDLFFRTAATLDEATRQGYQGELDLHRTLIDTFWERSDVVLDGMPLVQQALRYSLFSVLQATRRSEGHGVAAKGQTGLGYEGHYFWDTEIYVMPFLTYTAPDVARGLLLFRYRMLDAARRRAREVGHAGALFPWRTINGEEASAYYAAGTAQYHIDADVAYALAQYVQVTGDDNFLFRYGTEILVETARMWFDLGFFSERHDGSFIINGVTGPDEYATVVDNNLYTNVMAAHNLRYAAESLARIREESPDLYTRLVEKVDLNESEADEWRRAAERMYVPYDENTDLYLQDDDFLNREVWDFATTPPENYPLLLHYHPLVIYRHQVIKQADVTLATVLLPEIFSTEAKRRIFDYYDPLTTGDSSLSESVQAVAALEVGDDMTAVQYFIDAVSVDVADRAGNVRDGVHVASAGGAWMAVTYGIAGMRWEDGVLSFRPRTPFRARRLHFPLRIRATTLEVDIRPDEVTYSVTDGPAIRLRHHGQEIRVSVDAAVTLPREPQQP